MSAPNSDVAICNLAFDLLRHTDRVTSIATPVSLSESLAARWYDATRRSVLRAYPWNFARARAALNLNATAPAFGYANAYNLPNNYLGLVFIGDNYVDDYENDYTIEGNQILIDNNDGTLNICYIYDITDVPKFDAVFVDLLVAELAIRFANGITGLNKSMKSLGDWLKRMEAKARTANGRDNPIKHRHTSPVVDARRSAIRNVNVSDGVHLFT